MSETRFASPAVWVTCPRCTAQIPCYDPTGTEYFGCFNCQSYFAATPTLPENTARIISKFEPTIPPGPDPSLPLGAIGILGGYRCRLTGYQVRGEKKDQAADWREYHLRPAELQAGDNPIDFPLQLAEYQGHWLLIRRAREFPTTENPRPKGAREWTDKAGRNYRLWHRYEPVVLDAQGEFDWDILADEALSISEYTSPPYLLTSEQPTGRLATWYLAEHLEARQVADAFGLSVSQLPATYGIGAAQPGPVPSWPHLLRIVLAAVVALVVLQTLLVLLRPVVDESQSMLIAEPGPEATSQMLVSRSFEVRGPAALAVTLEAPGITNHWVELTASLVNEQTGRGYEFTRSLEYYEGVEDGESWREGDRTAEAVLSAVPSGRYHFNFYPTVDKGTGVAQFTWRTEVNTPLWSNFWLMLGALSLVPIVVGWRRNAFERTRWENSDFEPSATD